MFIFKAFGSFSELNIKVNTSNLDFKLFPQKGQTVFAGFLVFILVQWWSASIIDLPDMNGQKLMAAKNINEISKSIILPTMLFFVFNLLLYTLPVYIMFVNDIKSGISGEAAFFEIFKNGIPHNFHFLIFIFFLIPFISIVHNIQNWGGSLLVQNFYRHHIKKKAGEKQLNIIGIIVMIIITLSASVIAFYNDSLVNIFKFLFSITAGVCPVFILRWYWHRINAWSQFSAMVSSLIYPFIYDFAYNHSGLFQNSIEFLTTEINIEYYPLKILILTIIVCITWLSVTFLTKPTDAETTKRFVETVKPGGAWGRNVNKGTIFFKKRFFLWIILSAKGVLFYILWWKFITGNYWLFAVFSILYLLLLFTAYKLLIKINTDYAEG